MRAARNDATRAATRTSQRGAAAVEFALVVPVLLAIVFGIIDYGLFFSNSLAVRQGTRDGARQAVVGGAGYSAAGYAGCSVSVPQTQQIACKTNALVGNVAGQSSTKVIVPATWAKGAPLTVCSTVKSSVITGFVPLPSNGYVRSKSQLSIESPTAPTGGSYAEALPAGGSWSWCT